MRLDDWFLTPDERGNPSSTIDAHRSACAGWTEGNHVDFLLDGATYFAQLLEELSRLENGDTLRFTDWRCDGDERMTEDGPTIADVVAASCRRGVDVRGLLWRSHSDRLAFSAKENKRFATRVTEAGGEVLLDERVRRGGSHHQKLVLVRHPSFLDRDVAFVGGIDLSHSRRDDHRHLGNDQVVKMDARYGPRPAWHDAQLSLHGPAIGDLDLTFRERWNDPTPLNHSGRSRAFFSRVMSQNRTVSTMADQLPDPLPIGGHAVQILRTYPSRRPRYPFAPAGERSVARAFVKAIGRARTLIYIEDQYFWSVEIAKVLASALRRHQGLQLIGVVPRYPDKDGRFSGPPSRHAQTRAIEIVRSAGGRRVGFYDIENERGSPIYVHAKVCIVDDVWASVGSDNLNRRSWTHDSELACAVIDSELDMRMPRDPGGLGDGSRRFARDLRLSLWAEHLGYAMDDPALLDVANATQLWEAVALALCDGTRDAAQAHRTMGRIRSHENQPVPQGGRPLANVLYRLIFDPDGRPLSMRITNRF